MNLIIKFVVSIIVALVILGTTEARALTRDVVVGLAAFQYLHNPILTIEQQRQIWAETLVQLESGGDIWSISDVFHPYFAYGPLQISQPVLDDVNKSYHCHISPVQCRGNVKLSWSVFYAYEALWATEKYLGHAPTMEDQFRIWNGGPAGSGCHSYLTDGYWAKAQRIHDELYKKYVHRLIARMIAAQQ